jgi:hypothetical protein
MAIQRSKGELIKTLAWFLVAVGLIGSVIHFAPIISHGG